MLKLKISASAFAALPEAIQALYKGTDADGYNLQVEGVEDVSGLKTALNKERDNVKTLEGTVSTLESNLKTFDGVDPKRYKELEAMEKDVGDKTKGWDSMREQLNSTHAEEIKSKDVRISSLTSTLEDQMINQAATAEIERAGGSPLLLLPVLKSEAKLVEENDKFFVRLSKGSDPMLDNEGGHLTLAGRLSQLKADDSYGGAFKGSGASGGGKHPNDQKPGGSAPSNLNRAKMSTKEKSDYIEEHGQEKYLQLPMEQGAPAAPA